MHRICSIALVLLIALLVSKAGVAGAIDVPLPSIVVYITENPRLTKYHPGLAERITVAELRERRFRVLSPMAVRDFPSMCPRDVRGVWNADRLTEFRKHFNADLLWMADVGYKVEKAYGAYPVGGTMSIVVTAFSADTGKPVWFDKIESHELKGSTAEEAAKRALGEAIPGVIERFQNDPQIRTWVPAKPPRPWPPDVKVLTPARPTSSTTLGPGRHPEALPHPEPGRGPYTGVIVQADHLRVYPSYRTRLYSDRGRPIVLPDGTRMIWADRADLARRQAGDRPLHVRALRSEGPRIILRERDARLLDRQRELLQGGRLTIIVRRPGR